MKILIAGVDGYIGYLLFLHLTERGHDVFGLDNLSRRERVQKMGSWSAIPRPAYGLYEKQIYLGTTLDNKYLKRLISEIEPDAIVQLAEQPSAAYSMKSLQHCWMTQENNLKGTLNLLYAIKEVNPEIHLLKLGTMGEYGTPNINIPEGFFEIEYRGRKDVLPFPRQAGSWYHWSKVHGSNSIMYACKIWGLRATDVMQGIVYGVSLREKGDPLVQEIHKTRFDFDECFGTVVNRFVAMSLVDFPLTVYGKGGQSRGFIPLRESIECLTLALENPPEQAIYRVFNQFAGVHSILALVFNVINVAREMGFKASYQYVNNPRVEQEAHYYNPDIRELKDLGYVPKDDLIGDIKLVFEDLLPYIGRIQEKKHVLMPSIRWRE